HLRPQRHAAALKLGFLAALEPPLGVDALDVEDAARAVKVAPLEPPQFLGAQSGADEHDRDRSIARVQLVPDRLELLPALERSDLALLVDLHTPVANPGAGVRFEQAERHRLLEHLLERSERLMAGAGR